MCVFLLFCFSLTYFIYASRAYYNKAALELNTVQSSEM